MSAVVAKRRKVHKALFSVTNVMLPKAFKRKSCTDKTNSGITIDISSKDSTLGTLYIGQGGFTWQSKNQQKSKRLNWTEVAAALDTRLENRQPLK